MVFSSKQKVLLDCHYRICIDEVQIGFSKVTGLCSEMTTEEVVSGGSHDRTLVGSSEKPSVKTICLEKGVNEELEDVLKNTLVPGCHIHNLIICILNSAGGVYRSFGFTNPVVTKRSFSDLDAASGAIFLLKLEISHLGMVEL